jgi:hypothetical protein
MCYMPATLHIYFFKKKYHNKLTDGNLLQIDVKNISFTSNKLYILDSKRF